MQPANVNDYHASPCGCSNSANFEYNIDSPPSAAEESKDVKYKFNFEVERPKETAESDTEL